MRTTLERHRDRPIEADTHVVPSPPLVHAWLDTRRVDALFALALLPPLWLRVAHGGAAWMSLAAAAVIVTLAWQLVFAGARGRRASSSVDVHTLVTALGVALLVPDAAPLWQVALGVSFGVVLAEQIFGGRGYNLLHPVIAALAFLAFAFPGGDYEAAAPITWLSILPGALVLLATRALSARIPLGFALGFSGLAFALDVQLPTDAHVLGTGALTLFVLACEPVSAACTGLGRAVYGLLIGAFAALGLLHSDASLVLPVLVAQVFAPSIDRAVVATGRRHSTPRRERRRVR